MESDIVIFEQKFPTVQFGNVLMGVHRSLRPGETLKEAWAESKKESDESFTELFPKATILATDYFTGEQVSTPSAAQEKAEADKEFEDFKKQIDSFKTKEQAEKFLSLSAYHMAIDAKKYINNKFNTNGKK